MSELAVDEGPRRRACRRCGAGQTAAFHALAKAEAEQILAASMARSQGDAATRVQAHYRGQKGRRVATRASGCVHSRRPPAEAEARR